ncbi:MAG: YihY/virulence factor BrkB family protein [Brooklawnia sp.]
MYAHRTNGRQRIRSASYVLTSVMQRFSTNQGTNLAAILTYYAVFALFPSLVALVSIMKLSGVGDTLVPEFASMIQQAVPDAGTAEMLVDLIEGFFSASGAGIGLVIGIGTAVWAAAGYVQTFAQVMNQIHGVGEGRNPILLKLQVLAMTAISLIAVVVVLSAVVVGGDVAVWLSETFGLTAAAVRVWRLVRWPLIVVVVMALIAMLYHFTPNVAFPHFRPITWGSIIAVLTAAGAAQGFSFYVANFANYNAAYGALAGVMIALLLAWLVNVALVLGAQFDSELLRLKQLRSGLPAERTLQLRPRATGGIVKAEQTANKLAAKGYQIRLDAAEP